MKAQTPWSRFAVFCMLLAYILVWGVRVRLLGYGLQSADIIVLAIGVLIVWFIVTDIGRLEGPETKRRGWRRKHHRREVERPVIDDPGTVDPPPS